MNVAKTVLVVDDDAGIRRFVDTVLTGAGFRVLAADSAQAALSIIASGAHAIDLVMADMVMPNGSGLDLGCELQRTHPSIIMLYISGFGDSIAMESISRLFPEHVLLKPFPADALVAGVSRLLGGQPGLSNAQILPMAAAASSSASFPDRLPVESCGRGQRRVLVVDDEPAVIDLIREVLASVGFRVLTAQNGRDAMAALRRESADLLITDLVMPDKEGLELIMEARREWPALPIIAISGKFSGTYLKPALSLGAQAALFKPFSITQLLSSVRALLASGAKEQPTP